jgi:AraC-like DNA-binding protein
MAEISLIGFALALFILAILAAKKNKSLGDKILLVFILLVGLKLFGLAIEYKGWNPLFIFASIGDVFYWCLLGPLLFLFIQITIQGSVRLKPASLIHLLPLILVSAAFFDYLINFLTKESLGSYLGSHQTFLPTFGYYVFIMVSPVYFIAALFVLVKHRRSLGSFYSNTQKVDLAWLFYVTIGFGTYLVAGLTSIFLSQFLDIQLPFSIYRYTPLILVAYLFGLGYIGILRLPGFAEYHSFIKSDISGTDTETPLLATERYQKSGLSEKEAREIIRQLNQYMELKQPYLDENLNLKSLAEAMGTSTHKLSQALNGQLRVSFFEYINDLRIEEVKKRLTDSANQQYTLQAIAYDSGFCSKSTFYSTFRKKTGMTPGVFLKSRELQN